MHVVNAFDVSLQIVVEKLEKKGLVFKPNKGSDDDIEFVEHSEDWVGKYVLEIVAEIKKFLRITKNNLWSLLAMRGKRVHLHTLVDRERKRSSERG